MLVTASLRSGRVRAGEQLLTGAREGYRLGIRVGRTVLGSRAFNGDDVARFQGQSRPAGPHETARGGQLEPPIGDFTRLFVLRVDINPRVRVRPFELGHSASYLDRLICVEFRGERVMRNERPRGQ